MGVPRVPYHMRPREKPNHRMDGGYRTNSDKFTAMYLGFIRRITEGHVPIGFEVATRTFEAHATPRARRDYKEAIEAAREHVAYLKKPRHSVDVQDMPIRQHVLRHKLLSFLDHNR